MAAWGLSSREYASNTKSVNDVIFLLSFPESERPYSIFNSFGEDRNHLLRDLSGLVDPFDDLLFQDERSPWLILGPILMKGRLLLYLGHVYKI